MEVIVLGSINMDLVIKTDIFPKQGETVLGNGFFTSPGGKGANQATAIGKMGVKPIFIGCVGSDLYGNQLIETLSSNNVNTKNIKKVKQTTGVACITIYENDNRIILDSGANHYVKVEDIQNVLNSTSKDSIFLTQFENNIDSIIFGLSKAKELGMFTILNPAPFINTDKSIYKDLDFLILNQSECESLVGYKLITKADQIKALEDITKLGVRRTILTLGSEGSILYENNQIKEIEAIKTKVIDTTCAGDSYIGAFISLIAKGEDYFKACKFATKVASLTIAKQGAQNSIPDLDEM